MIALYITLATCLAAFAGFVVGRNRERERSKETMHCTQLVAGHEQDRLNGVIDKLRRQMESLRHRLQVEKNWRVKLQHQNAGLSGRLKIERQEHRESVQGAKS